MKKLSIENIERNFLWGIGVLSVAAAFLLASFGFSNAVHKGAGDLVCGQCHTMHNSQGGVNLQGATEGSIVLLRGDVTSRDKIHKFCLQCHASNGAQANAVHAPQNVRAPKVWSTSSWDSSMAFNQIGSGGNFSTEVNSSWDTVTSPTLGYGHSLGATAVTPPGGDQAVSYLTCTNCHDPHGTSNPANDTTRKVNLFRYLKMQPIDSGTISRTGWWTTWNYIYFDTYQGTTGAPYDHLRTRSYVGAITGPATYNTGATYFGGSETDNAGQVIWPVYRGALTGVPVSDSLNSNSYGTGVISSSAGADYRGFNMGDWCAACHDDWHETIKTTNKVQWTGFAENGYRDWRRHPVATTMPRGAAQGCNMGCHYGLPVPLDRANYSDTLIQAGRGLPVTASKYYSSNSYYLPWTGVSGMDDFNLGHKVFCLSCHFAHGGPYYDGLRWDHNNNIGTGAQDGNPISDSTGCQLCHNRGG